MPYRYFVNEIKGLFATAITIGGAIVANLPDIESFFRVGVSVAAIVASAVATRYWWIKGNDLIKKRARQKEDEETTT